VAARR